MIAASTENAFDIVEVGATLREIARGYPNSLPAKIKAECFDEVVVLVAANIAPGWKDAEVAVLGALSRLRGNYPDLFRSGRKLFGVKK